MGAKTSPMYEFGPFRLEPEEQVLLRDGKPTLLTPKAFDLLVFLVRNRGRLVTKDQILEAVWAGSFVEEANIAVLVSSLRKALGEKEAETRYIETVPKKGYRFTAPVSLAPVETARATSAAVVSKVNRPLVAAVFLIVFFLAIAGYVTYRKQHFQRSLAVLPFQNLRHDAESGFLGYSLADAVITKLDLLNSVSVRPSSAIEKYQDREIDIKKVAADLNVNTLLTGGYIRDGDQMRITYQLIDVPTNNILCKNVMDLPYDELLVVHDRVSKEIIDALSLNLTPSEAKRIAPDAPMNPLAYEYYLRGVDLMGRHNFPLAVQMLEKSTELDSRYPLAWAYLGQSYTSDATFELGGREQYRRAQAAYERALALQPKQLEAETFYANLLIDTGKVEQAVPMLRDAVAQHRNNAAAHWELGYAYRFAGMLNESVAECERAREIDPLVKGNGSVLNSYLYLGEYDKFLASLPDVNGSPFFRFYRGFGEYHEGNIEQAMQDFNRAYADDPTLYTGIGIAFADGIAKKNTEGLAVLRQFEDSIEQHGVGDPEATYKIAEAYAVLNDKASALRALHAAIEGGFFSYSYFVRDPLLNNLRQMPELPAIVNVARERHEAFKKKFFW
jgi:DNA-binding winged helix-turn-helix (wHTH) protein/TolB-like protein/Tfp pilus assembly protein PilF